MTAWVTLPPCWKSTDEIVDAEKGLGAHRKVFRGSKASRTASPTKTSSDSMSETTTKPVMPSQGALQIALALRQQLAKRGRARRQAEAEKVERRQGDDRGRGDERHEGQGRHHGVGQEVLEHDLGIGQAEGACRADIFEIAAAQELGPDDADERGPGEQQHDGEQDPEVRGDEGGEDDQQIEGRDRGPDLDEPLEEEVDPAAEIALHGAGNDADDRGQRW